MKNLAFIFVLIIFCNPCIQAQNIIEVEGAINIGDNDNSNPKAGTIRWNDATKDFEGFTGSAWKSLTKEAVVWENSTESSKINASDAFAGDLFGFSVSVSGDYAIVGAFADDDGGSSTGSAYIFERSGSSWTQQAKLTASDAAVGNFFGFSVSISGDYAIVGAKGDDDVGSNTGSAYIFERSGILWTQQAKLMASDAVANDGFGWSVSISGNLAIIGANFNDNGGVVDVGSAYIFERSGTLWTQHTILWASDAVSGMQFGISVSISGEYAIVSAHLYEDAGSPIGSAYIFERSGTSWTQQAKLTASDAAAGDQFGISVSISGEYAIVGAYLDDDGGLSSGSAYIFERSGTSWIQQAKLTASDDAADDQFGISVSISGDTAIVGAQQDENGGSSSGSAYIFKRSGTSWTQQAKLTASDAASGDFFGFSVSISGDTAIVGAKGDDDVGEASGSTYVY